jgi:hypothetical protein
VHKHDGLDLLVLRDILYQVVRIFIGTVTKELQKYLETVPGKHSVESLQLTAVIGTSHIKRKVLQSEM